MTKSRPSLLIMTSLPVLAFFVQNDMPTIYIFDSGAQFDHPDLKGRVRCEFTYENDNCEDHTGHGTHVTSIILGTHYKRPIVAEGFIVKVGSYGV